MSGCSTSKREILLVTLSRGETAIFTKNGAGLDVFCPSILLNLVDKEGQSVTNYLPADKDVKEGADEQGGDQRRCRLGEPWQISQLPPFGAKHPEIECSGLKVSPEVIVAQHKF